ncbi:MAG: hypothetical protein IK036_03485 [Clostridia bacterium]|nr:hypothetical protein [Clostridia bacterium]MBR5015598.1 hypothetical protein [Clostridia bacterium]MBR5976246.1 hypothetical protein [Clostridia bacterium]MBR5991798.1 hypothetical protein [Clostridia bacterium]MBR6479585.1 hypothetical protein [Clostridia bacterium]
MISMLIITIIAVIAVVLMMVCIMFAAIAIILMYTGRSATYDRAGKKMAKAAKPRKSRKK